ncbi:hypothetical protein LZG04_37850 [Saccharothrix sp. S26]|uniref:P-loop ATPase, Sll1717 family n=1 Tax=Saccharothrix sp. S26 TaxID=2907215 RepID=UPI001F2D2EC7|nr:hypothetical protein [Saccharothrix sp. S26]MCE7000540.1 hypothetical protein [Saccharothrix sp. S26]
MVYIDNLYFGAADAVNDVDSDPDRFMRTYLDRWDLPSLILDHKKFLILGPKGAGKSAAALYVSLRWKKELGDHAVFDTFVDFDELNRTQSPLTGLDSGLVSKEVNSPTDMAWRLFLGVRLLDSLVEDPACSLHNDPQVQKFIKELRQAGLASDDYPQVLRRVRERKGGVSVPRIASIESKSTEAETLSPGQVADAVLDLVISAITPNRHLLAIDGLDKAIADNPAYWQTVAALVRVVDGVRRRLRGSGSKHIFLLVMCRSDVFRRVRFSDSAKIAADGGIYMDWGAESNNPTEVLLWDYLAQKAEVSKMALLSMLPPVVKVAGGKRTFKSPGYLLQFTRYTPRDMTLLFEQIKNHAIRGVKLDSGQVRDAADKFASENLLLEIISESTGLLDDAVIDALEQILGSLPAHVFTYGELEKSLEKAGVSETITTGHFAEYLFLQGAIGNWNPDAGYVHFYHRRHTTKFNRSGPWILQTGLVYCLGVPFKKGDRYSQLN